VQLRVVEADLARDPQHLLRPCVHEHPDLQDAVGEDGSNLPRFFDTYPPGTLGEDEPDGVRAGIGSYAGVFDLLYAANLHLDH
jgi:hypothetical protein